MYDIIIIGAGINGAGIARDASGRGLKICLIEKGDIASETSSWSTKLIHGGLRYLENYEFRLVRESLKEREVIRKIAPHITKPLKFVMPHVPTLRPSWIIRLGLLIYDWLGGLTSLPKSKFINLENNFEDNPIRSNFKNGYEYSDLFVDDARLVLLNIKDAKNKGAKILTNTNIIETKRYSDHWEISVSNGEVLKSKIIINATGPHAINVLNNIFKLQSNKKLRLIQGSHIVVKKIYKGDQAYILQLNDRRVIFLIPYLNNYTLIGTTDHEVNTSDKPEITNSEKKYLIDSVNSFIDKKISESDIKWTYSGIRPLVEDFNPKASKVTRDYVFEVDEVAAPILTIFGGKLTTYRKLSEQALEKISKFIGFPKKSWTGDFILPGGKPDDKANLAIPKQLINRLKSTYGNEINKLNEYYKLFENGGEMITEDLYEFEVKYLIDEEMANSSEDIIFRRTKLGINFTETEINKLNTILKRHI